MSTANQMQLVTAIESIENSWNPASKASAKSTIQSSKSLKLVAISIPIWFPSSLTFFSFMTLLHIIELKTSTTKNHHSALLRRRAENVNVLLCRCAGL